ncbi:proheadase_HK97, phage prohead protease, HK97 family [uncultured Caudovirales phage]|uniref:Proheadase_HK97, phage prohead protease, HK97 family n=1 Tax=uncultured Caudovirales phage TaxID=2100421 RepID=A0A6J5S9D4_9CAUD|nr:proheadase_HK97, phage prohead protease, HK97 family [uncultured Caudovirales phage]CAB4210231.1 proheadase_HK97, phage prohead protease, HK97 family [uncultured Caudovirales phage]CAB5227572.1 proheadase_HK97, phage prohead protease, HK97 family [uncultured Caudovirales phage]
MSREFRQTPGALIEVRVTADGREGRITADVMKYNVVDDYRTTFAPGVFSKSLETRMPRVLWAHDSKDPIGQWIDVDDNKHRLRLSGMLDLDIIPGTAMPAVPSAHRAWAQLNSRTIDQFSVGFLRQADERNAPRQGITTITQALLDEASPVLVGSVPGAVLVSTRAQKQDIFGGTRLRLYPTTRGK